MIRTNEKKLVEFLLECKPGHPPAGRGFGVDSEGEPFHLPGIGGITLNISVGDSAFGWAGDHLEPGVSCQAGEKPFENPNVALNTFACAGNPAVILTGKAKGKRGIVIGHHGGSEHVMIEFERKVKEKLTYDDKIQIRSKGMGLELLDHPRVRATNLAPSLLRKMKIKEDRKKGVLKVPVTTMVPSECMGSGIGALNTSKGDYDIMTSDPASTKKHRLNKIRFGDFVALMDQDNSYGRAHRKGAVTIGIVVHSACRFAGHGPGVTTLLTCAKKGRIVPVIDRRANLADRLGIGAKRR